MTLRSWAFTWISSLKYFFFLCTFAELLIPLFGTYQFLICYLAFYLKFNCLKLHFLRAGVTYIAWWITYSSIFTLHMKELRLGDVNWYSRVFCLRDRARTRVGFSDYFFHCSHQWKWMNCCRFSTQTLPQDSPSSEANGKAVWDLKDKFCECWINIATELWSLS